MPETAYRRLAAAGQGVLVVLGLAWAFLERPAPVVSVRWRDGVSAERRQQLERQFFLEAGREEEGPWLYDLGWPAESNIAAILGSPDVLDTHHLNRTTHRLDDDVATSASRVWWAGPFRGSRGRAQFRAVVVLIAGCTIACAWLARRASGRDRPRRA